MEVVAEEEADDPLLAEAANLAERIRSVLGEPCPAKGERAIHGVLLMRADPKLTYRTVVTECGTSKDGISKYGRLVEELERRDGASAAEAKARAALPDLPLQVEAEWIKAMMPDHIERVEADDALLDPVSQNPYRKIRVISTGMDGGRRVTEYEVRYDPLIKNANAHEIARRNGRHLAREQAALRQLVLLDEEARRRRGDTAEENRRRLVEKVHRLQESALRAAEEAVNQKHRRMMAAQDEKRRMTEAREAKEASRMMMLQGRREEMEKRRNAAATKAQAKLNAKLERTRRDRERERESREKGKAQQAAVQRLVASRMAARCASAERVKALGGACGIFDSRDADYLAAENERMSQRLKSVRSKTDANISDEAAGMARSKAAAESKAAR